MILETSAIIAILLKEPEADDILNALESAQAESVLIAAPTFFETMMVTYQRLGESGLVELEKLGETIGWTIEGFSHSLAVIALYGYSRFHRGRHGLNFGDCFSYALAKARNDKLLCKGEDFRHTDISLVEY